VPEAIIDCTEELDTAFNNVTLNAFLSHFKYLNTGVFQASDISLRNISRIKPTYSLIFSNTLY